MTRVRDYDWEIYGRMETSTRELDTLPPQKFGPRGRTTNDEATSDNRPVSVAAAVLALLADNVNEVGDVASSSLMAVTERGSKRGATMTKGGWGGGVRLRRDRGGQSREYRPPILLLPRREDTTGGTTTTTTTTTTGYGMSTPFFVDRVVRRRVGVRC